jgi:predicted metalloprotease with PDZ domain
MNKDMCAWECIYTGAEPGSPAENSGLCGGDRIVSVNGKIISCPEDWDLAMKNRGETQVVVAIRNNQWKQFTIGVNKIDPDGKLMN